MKKVINATLGGRVYAFEEDAYVTLQTYLEAVANNLSNNPDKQEIIADVETAMAEHIQKRILHPNQSVDIQQIQELITQMGTPESYTVEKNMETPTPPPQQESTGEEEKSEKKLYRDAEHSVFAGVASGLSIYFGIDVVIVRVLFVIATLFWGWGILAYIILWITMPEAKTVSDKLRMRGKPVTVEKIEEYVYVAAQKAKQHAEGIAARVAQKQYREKDQDLNGGQAEKKSE